ncbi:MAG: class I SAM-dependent methyltransferase [Candidatus Tritonobacter lacicola]|nr:class I SAM-dependent methyltransferase [Candidatus Tritonobacter lacicola]
MKQDTFLHARSYERRVNWKKRLAREWPFFQKLFRDNGVKRVLDCACGTGRHAILFARNGYSVWGSDIDEGMIALSRENALKAGVEVTFVRSAFSELSRTFEGESFDAIICTGNSLGPLPDYHELHLSLKNMASIIAPGGIIILHILNYARLMEKKVEQLPVRHTRTGEKDLFFLKTFRHAGKRIQVEFIDIEGQGDNWTCRTHVGSLLPVLPSHLRKELEGINLTVEGEFGDYSFSPFNIHNSRDYIVVAKPRNPNHSTL